MSRSTARYARHLIVLVVLAVLFAQMVCAAAQLSATVDEAFHITSGFEYLRTGRLHLFDEHAPLAKALIAWPLFFVPDLAPPETAPGYASGDLISVAQETLLAYRPIDRVIVPPRVAAALLALLLAATIYRVTTILVGPGAGLLALLLCAFDPNFIAHGGLATTDMGATAFSFWALWIGALWIARPTRRRWWWGGVFLGLAQGVKLTALLVYPVLGLGLVATAGRAMMGRVTARKRVRVAGEAVADWRALGHRLLNYAVMVGLSFVVLWALYGFELRPVIGVLGGQVSVPAASHIERWLRLEENLAYGRESFLLGQNGMVGWVLYFPLAFLVKTPLALLVFGLWALSVWIREITANRAGMARSHRPVSKGFTLALFPVIYGLASLTSRLNIGYRHLLPVLPFLYTGIASVLGPLLSGKSAKSSPDLWLLLGKWRPARLAVVVLLTWICIGTLLSMPYYLTYFNVLGGGADNGWRFLADSNTDWGQTFKALAQYQAEHALGSVKLSSFTFYDPGAYGVVYESIPPMLGAPTILPQRFNPVPGIYAISATTLDGVPLVDPSMFDWFRHRDPVAQPGHAMLLYDVQPMSGEWLAQCSTPVAPLTEEAGAEGFGIPDLRTVRYDCEQSWVLPEGGQTSGWYARAIPESTRLRWPSAEPEPSKLLPEWVVDLDLEGLSLSYVQPRNRTLPAFAIWECNACSLLGEMDGAVELDGVVAYLGMSAPSVVRAGTAAEVATFWEVVALPRRPLSLKLHLSGLDGIPIVVGDGLGYPVEQWVPGDTFIQRHLLTLDEAVAPGEYTLRSGAYWLDDLTPLGEEDFVVRLRVE